MRFLTGVLALAAALVMAHIFAPKFWDWFWPNVAGEPVATRRLAD